MNNTNYFKNKKVAVVGLGRSGLACAGLLYGLGAEVKATDDKDTEAQRANCLKLNAKKIKFELGRHSREFIEDSGLVVVSPGVASSASPVAWARQFKIPVISEIELASILCPATIIATTGSNGKTTVTTLIGRVLEAWGKKVFTCGNIGNPFAAEVEKMREGDFVSLEVSSFQLEWVSSFKPKIALILNFSPNHLDRYKDIEEYWQAKKRIFKNQDASDYLVLGGDTPVLKAVDKEARAKAIYFYETPDFNANQAAVLTVAEILGIEKKLVLAVFKEFKGIEHRMEFVGDINNIRFINDSKSTTADSTLWALKNIDSPIILIAGGRHKGIDYGAILGLAQRKVRGAVLFGEAKERIADTLKGALPVEQASNLEEAVGRAYRKAEPGDCVLFSPMCSSFDMFSDYQERGRAFKEAVSQLGGDRQPGLTRLRGIPCL